MLLIYQLFTWLYFRIIRLSALFLPKANLWARGRLNWQSKLKDTLRPDETRIWIHCASLGEFEQGRPLIEALKAQYPSYRIVLTFFSPSGYEIRKNYPLADYIFYLPEDSPQNAREFIRLVRPAMTVFVKYEFWYFYLKTLKEQAIPTLLISSIFRPGQIFFKPYGSFFRKMLTFFTHIFVQNHSSLLLLQGIGCHNCSISGDTRIDRVADLSALAPADPIAGAFTEGRPTVICGSTWDADETLLIPFLVKHSSQYAWIMAPHEIEEKHLLSIESGIKKTAEEAGLSLPLVRYSRATPDNADGFQILLIDNIGKLSSLYQYAKIAYIGGGFGKGIHNILEPAAFGLPILFGPKYHKFEEAVALLESGGACVVEHLDSLEKAFAKWENKEKRKMASDASRAFILSNKGATRIVMTWIEKIIP